MGHDRTARHRKPKALKAKRAITMTAATGVVGASAMTGSGAEAATVSAWDKVAACESTNDWGINSGNGYYGGLQFSQSTWAAYGGRAYAARADLASKTQQILIAEKVLAGQGPGAWPVCGQRVGLKAGGPKPFAAATPKSVVKPKAAPKAKPKVIAGTAAKAVGFAHSKIGSRYLWGGSGTKAQGGRFDCSGLTQAAWRYAGVSIPRTADAQWKGLPRVSMSNLRPGDLIAFGYGSSYANHIGMYVGNGNLIDTATKHGGGVGISKLSQRAGGGSWHALGAVRPKGSTPGVVVKAAPPSTVNKGGPAVKAAPKKADAPKGRSSAGRAPTTWGGKAYKVTPGDYLYRVAERHNISGGWPALYAANRSVVGTDPDLIHPGQTLRMPS